MTLAQLQAAVYDETAYGSSPPTPVSTRITRLLNEGIRVVLATPGLSRLEDSDLPYTFSSVAGTARYVVPAAVSRILHITDRTNDYWLDPMSMTEYRRYEPDPTAVSGVPTRYVPIGKVAVATQPSDASAIFVKSASAGDTTQTAFIEGVRSGLPYAASVTLNGLTAAQLGSLSDITEITDFYLSATCAGTISLLEDSGVGTTLATIAVGEIRKRSYGFYLWPTPAAANSYYVDYRREIVDLANPNDEPPWPTDFHPMLVAYAVAREFETKKDVQRSVQAMQRFQKYLSQLKYYTQTLGDELPVMGNRRRMGRSRLGGFFPADSWS